MANNGFQDAGTGGLECAVETIRGVEEIHNERPDGLCDPDATEDPAIENSRTLHKPASIKSVLRDTPGTRSPDAIMYAQELSELATVTYRQFECSGRIEYINKAIACWGVALAIIPKAHQARPSRFEHIGQVSDLNEAVKHLLEALSLTPDDDPSEPLYLTNLSNSFRTRFELLGEVSDINIAIERGIRAVSLTRDDHPSKSGRLTTLGASYGARFEHLGDISDLDEAINLGERAVSLAPDHDPRKPKYLSNLGVSYRVRFENLGEISDLSNAVERGSWAVSLTPDGRPDKPLYLSNLGASYQTRFNRFGELPDINDAIKCTAGAVSAIPDGHVNKPAYLNSLGCSYETRFDQLGELFDLNKAIEYKAESVSLAPDAHPGKPAYLNNLGISYRARFNRLGEILDLNEAIRRGTQAVSLIADGHINKSMYLSNLGSSYQIRFDHLGEMLDLNEAIHLGAQAVSATPNGHPNKPGYLHNLACSYHSRFGRQGVISDLDKAIEQLRQAVSLAPNHPSKSLYLDGFAGLCRTRFYHLGEVSDLSNAVEQGAHAVEISPDGHPSKPAYLNNLGLSYQARFDCLGEISDLSKAIEQETQAVLLTPDGHPDKPGRLLNLGGSYKVRFHQLGDLADVRFALSSFRAAAQSPTGPTLHRFRACRQWALSSSYDNVPSPHPAYGLAMKLLPQLVWIGTTVARRYELIAEVGDFAAEAVSHAISSGSYDIALDWLEAGRSIVWGQTAQLRAPFERLAIHDHELAEELREVAWKLERASSRSSFLPETWSDNQDPVDQANSHIELARSWDALLEKTRSIPGFEDFLCSPTSSQLLSAAKHWPIAIVHSHGSRCDALILQPNRSNVTHLPLIGFPKEIAATACERLGVLIEQRGFKKVGSKSKPTENESSQLEESLKDLWLGVVKPVLEYLDFTGEYHVNELPHITWCTTGSLSFLPFHAAGCYDGSGSSTFNHVISSYTPTVGALLKSLSQASDVQCGLVAVGQEHTAGFSKLPCIADELKRIKNHACANLYLQLEGAEATTDQVLDAMDQFSWVHLACHGTQNAADPTQSAFHLHDGPLTLAAITKRSFANKGLAFLSACHTATGDRKVPDEAVHLAAGMLMAGYPSVIGTMWSIADDDGPEVADLVYAELLKDGSMDYTKAGSALHQAVTHLRAKVGVRDIMRWAPFIHIGL